MKACYKSKENKGPSSSGREMGKRICLLSLSQEVLTQNTGKSGEIFFIYKINYISHYLAIFYPSRCCIGN